MANEEGNEGNEGSVQTPPDVGNEASGDSIDAALAQAAIRSSAEQVISLFVPITLCMIIVVAIINMDPRFKQPKAEALNTAMFGSDATEKTDMGSTLWRSVSYALIILGAVIVMSVIVVLLYYYRLYKILKGILWFSSIIALFYFSYSYFTDVLTNYNVPFDFFTLAIVMWNYGVVGLIVIHLSGPLLLQQAYLIVISALLAVNFIKLLPEWSIWVLLALMSLWDLVAVLCPLGPLRILVETAQQREEPIFPALIYSSRMTWFVGIGDSQVTDSGKEAADKVTMNGKSHLKSADHNSGGVPEQSASVGKTEQHPGAQQDTKNSQQKEVEDGAEEKENSDDTSEDISSKAEAAAQSRARIVHDLIHREESGVKLGLGDFVFYSLLVGKASVTSDWNTTIACFIAILVGLSITLLLLFIIQKALPALPISIASGLIFYFASSFLVYDFVDYCQSHQIYV